MKFLSLATLALAPAAVIADVNSIIAATNSITEATLSFNETVASFTSVLGAIPILLGSSKLLNDINAGTTTAKASANLSDADALSLAGPVATLVADVQSTLQTVQSKKLVFELTLTAGIALLNLQEEKAASDAFSAAVLAKIPADLQATAAAIVAPLDPAFNAAIADFSTL